MVAPILSELILNRYLSSDVRHPSMEDTLGSLARVLGPSLKLQVWPFVEDIVSSWDPAG